MVTSAIIGSRVRDRINFIPSNVDSGNNILNFVEESIIVLENRLGVSIGTTAIGSSYIPLTIDNACSYTISKMLGFGGDVHSVADLLRQKEFYDKSVKMNVQALGHTIAGRYSKVNG